MKGMLLLFLVFDDTFFYGHILEFVRVEDFAAVQAFYVLNVLFAGNDANLGVFAGRVHGVCRLVKFGDIGKIVIRTRPMSNRIGSESCEKIRHGGRYGSEWDLDE